MAKITLIGLEQFLQPEHSLFEDLELPEGIDKETLTDTILLRCSEFEVLYPDPEFLKYAITTWGRRNYWTFDKWIKLINEEYDPLYNKDYHETWTDTHEGEYSKEGSDSTSGSNSESSDYTRTDNLKTENDITVTHSERAYNDATMADISEDVTDGEINDSGTQRNAGSTSGTFGSTGSNDESGDDSYTNEHTYHGYGNIGITSAQELFQRQAEVARFNIYEEIALLFCQSFCLMIYS